MSLWDHARSHGSIAQFFGFRCGSDDEQRGFEQTRDRLIDHGDREEGHSVRDIVLTFALLTLRYAQDLSWCGTRRRTLGSIGGSLDFTSLKRFSHTENHKCHSRRRSGAPLDPARQHLRRIWARIFIPPGPCQPMSRTRPSAESSSSLEVNSRTVFSVHARILVQDANKQVDAGARAGSARGARAASARRVIRVRTCPCSNA